MTLYEKFDIPAYWNKTVTINANDGTVYLGIMYDIVSEDDEPEAIAIEIDGFLVEIALSDVDTIKENRSCLKELKEKYIDLLRNCIAICFI